MKVEKLRRFFSTSSRQFQHLISDKNQKRTACSSILLARMGNLMERLKCAAHLLFPYTCKFFVYCYCFTNCAHIMCVREQHTYYRKKSSQNHAATIRPLPTACVCSLAGWLANVRATQIREKVGHWKMIQFLFFFILSHPKHILAAHWHRVKTSSRLLHNVSFIHSVVVMVCQPMWVSSWVYHIMLSTE